MAGIDLRYYDQLTDTWIAPLANGEDLDALQVLITQLGQEVELAVEDVDNAVSAVESAVQVVDDMSQTVTEIEQNVSELGTTVTTHLDEVTNFKNSFEILSLNQTGEFDLPDTNLITIGNPQGVCTDGTHFYVSFRQHLFKYNLKGQLIIDIDTTTMGTYGGCLGDCCYYDGHIYCTSSEFSGGGTLSKVMKFNSTTLSFVDEYNVPDVGNVLSTITNKDNYFYVTYWGNPTIIKKYDLSFSNELATFSISNGKYDGMVFIGDFLLLNRHENSNGTQKWGNLDIYYFNGEDIKFVKSIKKRDLWGQGIDVLNGSLLFAKRGYSLSKNKIILANLGHESMKPRARAYMLGNQIGIPSSVWTKVTLNSLNFDVLDDFDTNNNCFVAPVDGFYLVNYLVAWQNTSVTPNKRYSATVRVNGYEATPYPTDNKHSVMADWISNNGSSILQLRAGDNVELFAKHESGTTSNVFGTVYNTFMDITLL